MILAINANAALDRIFFIDRFVANTRMDALMSMECIGGKGLDTALVLKTLGAPVKAVSFIAGKTGDTLADLVLYHGIDATWLSVPGETRVANVIVETAFGQHSHITTKGYSVSRDDCHAFLETLDQFAPRADWAVIAGSLPNGAPPTFYRQVIDRLHEHNVKVLIDSYGTPMLKALDARPDIVKMNMSEFNKTFRRDVHDIPSGIDACHEQMAMSGIQSFVMTCGKDGIFAIHQNTVYRVNAIPVTPVNAAGAGDAVSAAIVYRLSLGDTWDQALKYAVATSTAVVITEGTAECSMADILRFYDAASVQTLA